VDPMLDAASAVRLSVQMNGSADSVSATPTTITAIVDTVSTTQGLLR
jgi:hypothetical protein